MLTTTRAVSELAPWLALSYTIHLADERLTGQGVAEWATRVAGMPFSNREWLIVNATSLAIVISVAWMVRVGRLGSFAGLVLAGHVFMHATQHAMGAIRFGEFSPGIVSGLMLCLPASVFAFAAGWRALGPTRATLAIALGGLTFQPIWHAVSLAVHANASIT